MNLYRAFRVSSNLMIAVGLLSIALAEGSLFYLFIALAGIALGWIYEKNPIISHSTGTAAALLCVAYTPLDYLLVTQDIIVTGGHLLILFQVIRLLSVRKNRDYLLMFPVSLLQLAVAAVLTIELDFSIPFVLYLVFATWTMILFHLKREFERSLRLSGESDLPDDIKIEKTRGVVSPSFFVGSTSICVVTLVLTSVFFLAMPRISARILPYALRPMRVSGFSESIDLGISGDITPGEREVMRVRMLNVSGPALDLAYWRGVGLSHYDGEKWRKYTPEEIDPVTVEDIAAMHPDRKSHSMVISEGKRVFSINHYRKDPENTLVQRILQSPLDTKVLFGMHPIYRIEFFSREAPVAIETDSRGSVYNRASQYGFVGYDVYSLILDPNSPELETAATYPVVDGTDYTQLPAPGIAFRYRDLKGLAEKIIEDAGARTQIAKVRAIENYLSTELSYTRNIRRTPDVEPVYDFLFNQKAGHCELFASSMAVLLRTLGIPARVANGYRGGQWNPYGEFYLVRQMDAHCWVEVYFDRDRDSLNHNEIGWVRFDPTPPSLLDEGGFLSPVTDFFSYLRLKWIDYVISYSAVEQRKVAFEVRDRGRQMRGWFNRFFKSVKDFFSEPAEDVREKAFRIFLFAIPPVAGVLALIVFLRGRRKKPRKPRKPIRPREISVGFYRDLLRALERAGMRRTYSQTPSEFARAVSASAPILAQSTWAITSRFLAIRFGDKKIDQAETAAMHTAVQQVKTGVQTLRASRRRKTAK